MPKGIPLTDEELTRRRDEISAVSVNLFVEKGFSETSMREIAAAAGMGKSSLYDYFRTKDDILLWSVEHEILAITKLVQEVKRQPITVTERLWRVMQVQADFLITRRDYYMKLMFEVQRLGIQSQRRVQARRHEYQDLVRELIDEGIEEGVFRPVDSLLAARTIITLLTPTVFTTRPTGTPEEMLGAVFSIVLKGIEA